MSFSEAIAKAKAAAEAENLKKEDAPRAQTSSTAFEPRKAEEEEDEEDDEEFELRMPGSFDLGNSGAAAPATGAAGGPATVDPLDVVGVLGNVWRRMQLR
jgi:UDP-N-acetylmuramyl tripeptide synthase